MLGIFDTWLSAIVVAVALASVMGILFQRQKSDAEVMYSVFCGSLAMSLLRPELEVHSGWLFWAVSVGSCATCNAYWLVSRGLFREQGAVGRVPMLVAGGIAAMIVMYRVVEANAGSASAELKIVDAFLTLASSTILVLSFSEALRGWSTSIPRAEKRLRILFMIIYGGCVAVASTTAALKNAWPQGEVIHAWAVAACALSVLLFTPAALAYRRRHPLLLSGLAEHTKAFSPIAPTKEEQDTAQALLILLEHSKIYREPELKVADVALRLGSAEHKVSKVITQVLGERNFNQLVNRYRIEHACRLLEDEASSRSVLDISQEVGFASLGPFNRAFKIATGQTPSVYRLSRPSTDSLVESQA